MRQSLFRICIKLLLCCCIASLVGCASRSAVDPQDPYQAYNRKIFAFNMGVDKILLRPMAKSYDFIMPNYLRARVSNAFDNLGTVTTVFNDVLQAKIAYATTDLWRLIINTTLGLGGMYDVASKIGFPKHEEDFGLTLAQWGATDSAFFMTPFLGPSTLRDTFGSGVDLVGLHYALWKWINPPWLQWAIYGLQVVNTRANLLVSDPLVEQAFDPYVFVRDAYMQQRQQEIAANKVPFKDLYGRKNQLEAGSGAKPEDATQQHGQVVIG